MLPVVIDKEAATLIEETAILLNKMETIKLQSDHVFQNGFYLRTTYNPACTMVVSKVHKESNVLFILKGNCLILENDGNSYQASAPQIIFTKPGTRRLIHCLDEVICMTIHKTDATTVEEVEESLFSDSYKGYLECQQLQLQQ